MATSGHLCLANFRSRRGGGDRFDDWVMRDCISDIFSPSLWPRDVPKEGSYSRPSTARSKVKTPSSLVGRPTTSGWRKVRTASWYPARQCSSIL
jgi:hypothetical protein